jgi:hypothetical protein
MFGKVGGKARNGFAEVDPLSGAPLDLGPVLPVHAQVTALAVVDTTVYLSGSGLGADVTPHPLEQLDQYAPGFGGYDVSSGAVIWHPRIASIRRTMPAGSMQVVGKQLYIGGVIVEQADTTHLTSSRRSMVMALDLVSGNEVAIAPTLLSQSGYMEIPLTVVGNNLFVGGAFTLTTGYRMPYFALFDIQGSASVPPVSQSGDHPGITLYPNPAATLLTFRTTGASLPATVHVVNALGVTVMQVPVVGEQSTISVAGLPNGMYALQAGSNICPFVVQR